MSSLRDNNLTCNGTSVVPTYSVPKVKNPVVTSNLMSSVPNLNWLLHLMFIRQDYTYCKAIIERQMKEYCNLEYLYFIQGLIAREEGHYQDAVKNLQIAVEMEPSNSEYYKEIGRTLLMMGKLKQALEVFLRAESLQQRPDSEIFYNIGELIYRNAGRPKMGIKEAKEYFLKAIQHGKQDIESYRKLAGIYIKENEFQKAIDMLESCLV